MRPHNVTNLEADAAVAAPSGSPRPSMLVGRYGVFDPIGSGGMATVHLGRLLGTAGFARVVAIKRMRPHLAEDREFVAMFRDEARLAARITHANVVRTVDVVEHKGELFIVMEYVDGESLAHLLAASGNMGDGIRPAIASAIACGVLHGLHAAHEARTEKNEPLGIIHRDVSPQNVLVGCDGVARVLDFGVARAVGREQVTLNGQIKGKVRYLAPELLENAEADRRADVYGAAVVLWETLTGATLFDGPHDGVICRKVLAGQIERPRTICPGISHGLEAIVMKGLERDPKRRFATAREMALALQTECGVVAPSEIGQWVADVAGERLALRARQVADLEKSSFLSSYPQGGWTSTPRDPRDVLSAILSAIPSRDTLPNKATADTRVEPRTKRGRTTPKRGPFRTSHWADRLALAAGLCSLVLAMCYCHRFAESKSGGTPNRHTAPSLPVPPTSPPVASLLADTESGPEASRAIAAPAQAAAPPATAPLASPAPPPKTPKRVAPGPKGRRDRSIDGI